MVLFWVALLAISISIYLLLDGFDLGVGMLFALAGSEGDRDTMLDTVAPVWDGNETWLVVAGVILWGAFPLVYATLLSAFYLPVIIMLLGLILRGVAFEFRHRAAPKFRWIWDVSFVGGSLAASFMQGATVGALVQGLKFSDGVYVGGVLGWLSSFSVLCGIGLCLGYALLGASWLVQKCELGVRDRARRQIPGLALAVLAFLIIVFAHALIENLPIMHRWLDRPYLFVFPAVGAMAAVVLASSILHHNDRWPFAAVAVIFVAAFGTLALSFWPYMIPFAITIDEAAAPRASLAFMFWGEGLFVFPLMVLYVAIGYRVFRGKVGGTAGHY
ncbi:cytochrome d ubiquinol oxidase subunit II [Bradyrhizobium sp. Bra64]|uniref:cytochrome d ubiquinol oxidase subunit II n=1 Tax=Bradyrhizobium sp. Bra64 TaxID=2926009 RepID=UPI0021191047|nr:cytochrome d ubiquinol oxidase subunit II [Bradyrhizobium sp. Bra64]